MGFQEKNAVQVWTKQTYDTLYNIEFNGIEEINCNILAQTKCFKR